MKHPKHKTLKQEHRSIIFNSLFAVLTLIFPILFYKQILLTTLLVFIITLVGLFKWKTKLRLNIAIFLFGAIFGALAEIISINYGVWSYSLTNFFNIPSWLFIVWGNASLFIYQTAIEFERLGLHK